MTNFNEHSMPVSTVRSPASMPTYRLAVLSDTGEVVASLPVTDSMVTIEGQLVLELGRLCSEPRRKTGRGTPHYTNGDGQLELGVTTIRYARKGQPRFIVVAVIKAPVGRQKRLGAARNGDRVLFHG